MVPDPTIHLNADPDPTFHFDKDLDPYPDKDLDPYPDFSLSRRSESESRSLPSTLSLFLCLCVISQVRGSGERADCQGPWDFCEVKSLSHTVSKLVMML